MRLTTATPSPLLRLALLTALAGATFAIAPQSAHAQVAELAQHSEDVAAIPDERPDDETRWALSAGANISTGNTRAQNFNAGTDFYARRGRHATSFVSAFNYGRVSLDPDMPRDYTVSIRNLNSRFRYDVFLTDNDALFLALGHRWDTFAGLQTRAQVQAGYLRNLISNDNSRMWIEAGYDFTFDNRANANGQRVICSQDMVDMMFEGCTRVVRNFQNIHALRLYYGLTHKFSDDVRIATGLEFLVNLNELEGGEADRFEDVRLTYDASLNARLIESLAIELKFRLQFDNVPAAREKLDTNTIISLIYTLI